MSRSTGAPRSAWLPATGALSVLLLAAALQLPAPSAAAAPAATVPEAPPSPTSPTSPPAPDQTPTTPALVELTGLNPIDAASGDTVTFDGVVTNRSDQPLALLNAHLRLSRIPLADRVDLEQLADPDYRPGARQAAFVLASDLLAPGASAEFSLAVPAADLRLSEAGVYPAGIEVLATVADGSRGVVGRTMTALPWMPAESSVAPVGVAVAWPVTAPVDRAADGSYLSDELGSAMSPGGHLAAILGPSADAQVTWLVDPAVVEAAVDLADGYAVRADPLDPASAQPGTSGAFAADWLDQVRVLADAGRVTLLPYADVDAVGLGRAGQGDAVPLAVEAAVAAADALGLDGADRPQAMLRPPGGLIDAPTAERFVAAGVTTLLLDASNVTTDGTAPAARLEVDGRAVTAVLVDDGLHDLFVGAGIADGPGAPATELGARQVLLAHTALAALAAPTDIGYVGQTVLVVSGDEASTISPVGVLDALDQDVPWMQHASLEAVRASPMVDGELDYPETASSTELSGEFLAGVAALEAKAELRAELVAPGDQAADETEQEPSGLDALTASRLRLTSAAWRSEPERAAAALAQAVGAVDADLGRVRILDGDGITLSSQAGRFPLTVVNDLTVPVAVQLTLVSRTPARLRVPNVTAIEVAPGARTTVDVSAEANANGEYVVDARLATSSGAPFGPSSPLTIRATDYDTVAWIVMGVAGSLLLVGSVRRISRRVGAARSASTPPVASP